MTSEAIDSRRVALDELYRRCDPDELPFETTAEVAPADGTVGQERAVQSLEFGLGIEAKDYNLFIAGPAGTGRNSTLRAIVHRIAAQRPPPPDWCYLFNFQDPRQPPVISLPAGRGRALARDMDTFVEACRREIPRHFEDEGYAKQREEIGRELQAQRDKVFAPIEEQAKQRGFAINATQMGVATVPVKADGQPMSREEFSQLPEAQRQEIQTKGEALQSLISEALPQVRRLEKEATARLQDVDKQLTLHAITPPLNELRQEYLDIPTAMEYFELVQDDIVGHLDMFRSSEQGPPTPMALLRPPADEFFTRYRVNVFVSQERTEGAPVVVENNPTYYKLFGRVDYRAQFGATSTDHTMIKAGAMHRANGGFLILQGLDVLTNPLVWETLKRTLRCREVDIENLGEQFSAIPVTTLDPQAIPLDVKVVIVGSPRIYHVLYQADDEFRKLFRVKADFSNDMERSPECVALYAGFISSRVREEKLRPFHKSAVARVVEYGSRLVEHQRKLSTQFIDISDLLTEANYWAGGASSDVVRAEHVERAIGEKIYRSNLIEERIHQLIEDGTIMIDTQRAIIGQVNGISVFELGDYSFGRPSRITARVSLGRGQVISIEREIQLSGKIHNKGFAIMSGYLQGKFAQERPLALSASISFEQTYDEIDGDSASAAELYVLLSSLAEVPIKQGIAVTGSVNQRGEVQPIGGANQKIEGFFAVCKAKGLTGEQGVAIPKTNVQNLMLRREVLDAVRDGRFHIWSVENVDQGIEILTGVPAGAPDSRGRYPAGSINRLVTDKLAGMSRRLVASGRGPRRRGGQAPSDENDNASS